MLRIFGADASQSRLIFGRRSAGVSFWSIWIMGRSGLERLHVEATIHIEDLAGGIWEVAVSDRGDCTADVGGLPPAIDRSESASEEGVVLLFHGAGHVGGDDARLDLEHADAELCKAHRVKLGHH